ncbi:MAG: glycosyltransferase [Planctomycetota bacterium]|nr:glycosyltransferase [Planctomycetota bacterium]
MKYLLVNHVPFGRTAAAGAYQVGDMWLEDLRAEGRAIRAAGGQLIVATPCMDQLEQKASGSFHHVTIRPQDEGFEYIPLPFFISMAQFLRARRSLRAALKQAVERSTIVQADTGGHPVALGQVVWPLAGAMGKRRIWAFDGADPFPRLELYASEDRNPVRRFAKNWLVNNFRTFCRSAIQEADLVFSHNRAVVERFKDVWSDHCYLFDRTFVTTEMLLMPDEAAARKSALLAGGPLRLVAVGRQIKIKATDHVLQAMAIARRAGADLELDVLGDGEDLPAFKSLAQQLGLTDKAHFLGTIPYGRQLYDVMKRSHVLAITNLTAEISRNVMLGMALGLPLIIYRNAGTDGVIEESGAGTLVPCGDVDALAAAFIGAAKDRQLLARQIDLGLATAKLKTLDACHEQRISVVCSRLLQSQKVTQAS